MLAGVLLALSIGCSDAAGQNATPEASTAADSSSQEAAGSSAASSPDAGAVTSATEHDLPPIAEPDPEPDRSPTPEPDLSAPEPEPEPEPDLAPAPAPRPASAPASTPGNPSPAPATLLNPAPGSKFFVGANFWNIGWQGSADYFTRGTNFATTDNPWRPDFIRDLEPYHVLRFMDWNLTNEANNAEARWSTRLQKTAEQRDSVALEWQIDLCNRAKTDCWITVPHETTAEYWTQLAKLVHETLDPSLRIYVEWSNEIWNMQFPQRGYAQSQGNALGLAGSDKAASYLVHQSVRVFEAFEAVFGKDSPRLVKVLAGQAQYAGPCESHLGALADPKINPKHTRASVYAIAPYPKGASVASLRASLGDVQSWVEDNAACARKADLPLISYEGGTDSFGSDNGQACRTLQRDPGMRDLYGRFLDAMYDAKLLGPFMQYTHSGACWGLKQSTDDDLASSPKYQALLDWTAAHP